MSSPSQGEFWRVDWSSDYPSLAGGTVELLTTPNEDNMVKVKRVIIDWIPADQLRLTGSRPISCDQKLNPR